MKLMVVGLVSIFAVMSPVCALSQDLYNEAVEVALVYPGLFDDYVASSKSKFDMGFLDCMNGSHTKIAQQLQIYRAECDKVVNPEQRPYNQGCKMFKN